MMLVEIPNILALAPLGQSSMNDKRRREPQEEVFAEEIIREEEGVVVPKRRVKSRLAFAKYQSPLLSGAAVMSIHQEVSLVDMANVATKAYKKTEQTVDSAAVLTRIAV